MSWLYFLTHNIPPFIRTPAIALLGPECYTNLVYNLQLDHIFCLKYGISKALSLAIVCGSAIVKVPQIVKIISAKSARGLSLTGFLLDSIGLIIIVSYNYRHDFPLSTYGESFLLLIQNMVIIALIVALSRHPHAPLLALLAVLVPALVLAAVMLPGSPVPSPLLQMLLTLTIPLALGAKVPQIAANFAKRSTGQLSGFLVCSSLLGCLARLFTTSTETGDPTLLINFGCGSALNAILALQMLGYSRKPTRPNTTQVELDPVRASSSSLTPKLSTDKPKINLDSPKQWTRKAE